MPLELFEFLEQFMIECLLIKTNQFEKTASVGDFWEIIFYFRNLKSITIFCDLHIFGCLMTSL